MTAAPKPAAAGHVQGLSGIAPRGLADPVAACLLEIARTYAASPTLAVPPALEAALEKAAPILTRYYGHRNIQIKTRAEYWGKSS